MATKSKSPKEPKSEKEPEVTPGLVQYKSALRQYMNKVNILNQLDKQYTSTKAQAVNLEGQISALTEAFGFDEQNTIREIHMEDQVSNI